MPGIVLVEYSKEWPKHFENEARLIRQTMGESALLIEHVGSTSVPGLSAKPVIDIQISVDQLNDLTVYKDALASVGYVYVSLPPPPKDSGLEHADKVYLFFQKPAAWPATHHVHLCLTRSVLERNHLVFRDYLRDNPAKTDAYLALKMRLAGEHRGLSARSRENYSLGKTEFVRSVINEALAKSYDCA